MKWLITISFLLIIPFVYSQEVNKKVVNAIVLDGDTIADITLDEVEVLLLKYPKSKRGKKRLTRYVKNVKKVLPYAKLAGSKLREYEDILKNVESDKQRRKIMKQAEEEIKEEYGQTLKDLTFSQGFILIKLIDRETGNSSYELVQELRGKFSAFFYQTFARLWGYNLKTKYDPEGEDKQLEVIVRLIELGRL
ncbi:MAG: DUF4294 domain-containing protein [Marinilabiliales bacterium]|nr:MAG: DUF4294 domain-containing protein [Marinilabiliales bacterium]